MDDYEVLLSDPRWISKSQQIKTRDNFKCTKCNYEYMLQVHHKYYVRGRKPWDYPDSALITVCSVCHHKIHSSKMPIRTYPIGDPTLLRLEHPELFPRKVNPEQMEVYPSSENNSTSLIEIILAPFAALYVILGILLKPFLFVAPVILVLMLLAKACN